MKKSFCLAFILTSLVVLCLTGGCKVDVETPDYNLHTVTFECNGGSRISPQILVHGTTAAEPRRDPSKDGGQFLGWYSDPQFNTPFDFGTPITQDVTVYAKWVYEVYFVDYDGHALKSVDVVHGNKVSRPDKESLKSWKLHNHYSDCFLESEYGIDDEYKSHLNGNYCLYDNLLDEWYDSFDWYDYCDWYDDKTWLETFDFEKPILDSEAIYAGYKPWVVTFECNGGSEVSPQKISGGKTVSRPENPTKDGYAFDGWYSDAACNSKYDFTNEVWEPKTLYAKWHEFKITKYKELPAGTDGTAGSSWTYVEFGEWPQTIKAENVTVDENVSIEVGMFTYYKGNDGAWYVKTGERAGSVVVTGRDERGEPIYASEIKYSDGTSLGIGMQSFKYFKVEPIKWRVLTDNYNGKKLLLAENCLMHRPRDRDYSIGEEIYGWLDKDFLITAFVKSEQDKIAETNVDNSARSGNPDSGELKRFDVYVAPSDVMYMSFTNTCSYDNTKNKIFLLSEQEVTKSEYGFEEYDVFKGDSKGTATSSRIRMATDFVKACGGGGNYREESVGLGDAWILRSITDSTILGAGHSKENTYIFPVDSAGCAFSFSDIARRFLLRRTISNNEVGGIVPALCVEN
ncbi:MAG: InlB B-repeat-containing protein [Treponema sp.]|nr:InlB B-repeat-containing protein [Treponema sp.]